MSISDPSSVPSSRREFDFWIGTWNVQDTTGRPLGKSVVAREYNGYVLLENYTKITPEIQEFPYRGQSLNIFDATRRVWHQTWVDSEGGLLVLEGGMDGGRMVLVGQTLEEDGSVISHRIGWVPNTDGSVEQLWEVSSDAVWTTKFLGIYRRA